MCIRRWRKSRIVRARKEAGGLFDRGRFNPDFGVPSDVIPRIQTTLNHLAIRAACPFSQCPTCTFSRAMR